MIAKPIDVIAGFIILEKPRPYRIRYKDENGYENIIKVEKVLDIEVSNIPGPRSYVYKCQSTKGMNQYRFELLYKPDTHSWLLYKI